jgi:hypothetical protein
MGYLDGEQRPCARNQFLEIVNELLIWDITYSGHYSPAVRATFSPKVSSSMVLSTSRRGILKEVIGRVYVSFFFFSFLFFFQKGKEGEKWRDEILTNNYPQRKPKSKEDYERNRKREVDKVEEVEE